MTTFYIRSKIKQKLIEQESYKKKRHWFSWELDTRNKYLVLCEIDKGGYNAPLFKIPVSKEEFRRLKVNDFVSISIKATYRSHVLHFSDGKEKVQYEIVEV